jgi:hypothetical protein
LKREDEETRRNKERKDNKKEIEKISVDSNEKSCNTEEYKFGREY